MGAHAWREHLPFDSQSEMPWKLCALAEAADVEGDDQDVTDVRSVRGVAREVLHELMIRDN